MLFHMQRNTETMLFCMQRNTKTMPFCMQRNTKTVYAFRFAAQYCNCRWNFSTQCNVGIVDTLVHAAATSYALLYAVQYWKYRCIGLGSAILKILIPFCVKANNETTDTLSYAAQYWNCRYISLCSVLLDLPTPFVCSAMLELATPFCSQRITGTVGTLFN